MAIPSPSSDQDKDQHRHGGLWDIAERTGNMLAKSQMRSSGGQDAGASPAGTGASATRAAGSSGVSGPRRRVAASSPEDQGDGADRRVTEETSQALSERLRDRWATLELAEARLAAGTYGVSILSGRPIPDDRLEAFPLAELTVEEAAQRDRDLGGRREPESRMGPSSDPFRVFDDPAAQDGGLVEDEGSDDEPGPEANLGVRTIPET
jgi:DnaK suppressor protein